MNQRRKKILAIIMIALVLLLGAAAIVVTVLLQRAEVPTAPTSIPRAAEWLGGANCNVSFTVAAPGLLTCTTKTAYRNVASNTAGNYNLDGVNLLAPSATVSAGQTIVYVVNYTNSTTAAIDSSIITDQLDSRLEYIDGQTGCSVGITNGVVQCNIGRVAAGATSRVAFRVRVRTGATSGTLSNTAVVTGSNSCTVALTVPGAAVTPATCNNTCSATIPCATGLSCVSGACRNPNCNTETDCTCPTPTAVISCDSKQAYRNESTNTAGTYSYLETMDTVAPNETFVYDIKFKNTGNATASAVTVTDTLNGENQSLLEFVDANGGCTYNSANRTVTCTSTNVAPNTTVAFAFRAKLSASAANSLVVKNTSTVTFGSSTTTCAKDLTVVGVASCNNSCSETVACASGLTCVSGSCRNNTCSAETDCVCPGATVTPASCNNTCSETVACASGLTCVSGSCRNNTCSAETDCVCATATQPPAATTTAPTTVAGEVPAEVTAAPTAASLPEAGIFNLPGAAVFGGGLLLTILGILFAL